MKERWSDLLNHSAKQQSLFFKQPQKDDQSSWWEVHPWQSTIMGPLKNRLRSPASQSRAEILNPRPQTSTTQQLAHSVGEWWVSKWSFICTDSPQPLTIPHITALSQCCRYSDVSKNNINKEHNKCNAFESSWNHRPPAQSVEKLFSRKLVPCAQKLGDLWSRTWKLGASGLKSGQWMRFYDLLGASPWYLWQRTHIPMQET